MTNDESELTRIRYEDLSPSLQSLIDNLITFDDPSYVALRTSVSKLSDMIDSSTSVFAGNKEPTEITLGKTVYFNTKECNVRIADSNGDWIYLS